LLVGTIKYHQPTPTQEDNMSIMTFARIFRITPASTARLFGVDNRAGRRA